MIRKYNYSLFIFILIALIGISCNTTGSANAPIDINGMIYDFSNRPVAYCTIILGELYTGSTDISGRFTLPRIPPGAYTITGYKEGYEIYTDEIIIREQGQIIYIRIPSQIQLLNLVDEALTAMNFDAADEYIQRAYQIDKNNIEMLFYYATTKFRQHKYDEAISFLMTAKNLGSKDTYIDRFLAVLRELTDAEN
jgi:tetratricopeptide (TPR) repeat protein